MLEKYPDVLNVCDLCKILRISKKTAYPTVSSKRAKFLIDR